MRFNPRRMCSLIVLPLLLMVLTANSFGPICAYGSLLIEAKPIATMVLMTAPASSTEVVLAAWNKTEQIHTTLEPASIVRGKCIHCNVAMSFTADQASAHCSVCPCSHSFAGCLTVKGSQKTNWADMLGALPLGTGLRIEFNNPQKPSAGAKLFEVDVRSVLLPLAKPLEVSDADFLAMIKPIGLYALERANGDRLLRLAAKDDWTNDRAQRLTRILAEHGIVLDFVTATKQ